MTGIFRFLSHFPLGLLHAIGAVTGWLVYGLSARFRKRWHENCAQAGLSSHQARSGIAHNGRMMLELPRLWLGKPVPTFWQGVEHIEHAYAQRRGIVFLTPHLGCFEITAQMVAERFHAQYGDLTVMYRPPNQGWMAEMMTYVRNRPGLRTVPTTLAGVRQMVRELRQGRAVGLLPDHVPPQGQGVWAPFFGRPAYTMTLAAKLVHQTNATLIIVWGERLPAARGYCLHCMPMREPLSPDLQTAVTQINQAMEALILSAPDQYMWSYARYRNPRAQPGTEGSAESTAPTTAPTSPPATPPTAASDDASPHNTSAHTQPATNNGVSAATTASSTPVQGKDATLAPPSSGAPIDSAEDPTATTGGPSA